MAAITNSVWAIDIGNTSVKAIRVRLTEKGIEVIGFDNIEHEKTLTSPGVTDDEREELIAASMRQLAEKHGLTTDEVVISVGGHNSFARFIKLPPVEPKGIPKIVRYEAIQQVPFDINEVEWDWQVMDKPGSKELEVGIFAIKNELVSREMEYFGRENIKVTCVQMAPMALYNYAVYDRKDVGESDKQGIVVLNMGAENTDLVICTKTGVWQRSIPMGGNTFTRAIADAFKLKFQKAEKLKRTAPMSKYARQILQAMKPVFADLATEIQRSLGFYTSANRQVNLSKVVALGGGVKLQGLTKFLQQTLQMPVIRPDSFEKLRVGRGVSAAKFHEHVGEFGIVYGLAVQGLGLGRIQSNLLPRKVARMMMWSRKGKRFMVAAAAIAVVCFLGFVRASYDRSQYGGKSGVRTKYMTIVGDAQQALNRLIEEKKKSAESAAEITKRMDLFKYRDVVGKLNEMLIACLPNEQNNRGQAELYRAFAEGDIAGVMSYPRKQRQQLFVTGVSINYADDLSSAQFGKQVRRRTRTRGKSSMMRGFPGGVPLYMRRLMGRGVPGMMPGGAPMQMPQMPTPTRKTKADKAKQAEAKKAPGFLVVMEGCSPYEDIMDLLDPAVEGGADETRWGVKTRFRKLQEIFQECQFELYSIEHDHFQIERGEVDMSATDMPEGIGEEQNKTIGSDTESDKESEKIAVGPGQRRRMMTSLMGAGYETVLVDPMTKEVISRVMERDEKSQPVYSGSNQPKYQVNDHWFRIKAKFVWKDAPKEAPVKTRSPRRRS